MRNVLCFVLLFATTSLFANVITIEGNNEVLKVSQETKQSKAEKKRKDLKEKLVQMDGYVACNFIAEDETKAIADGDIFMSPVSMKAFKEFVMKDRNVLINSIFIISANDSREFGEFEVCAGGIYYKYYNTRVDNKVGFSRNK